MFNALRNSLTDIPSGKYFSISSLFLLTSAILKLVAFKPSIFSALNTLAFAYFSIIDIIFILSLSKATIKLVSGLSLITLITSSKGLEGDILISTYPSRVGLYKSHTASLSSVLIPSLVSGDISITTWSADFNNLLTTSICPL